MSNIPRRRLKEKLFKALCVLMTFSSVGILAILLSHIVSEGWSALDIQFFTNYPSAMFPEKAGIKAAFWGTIWIMGLTALFSIPLGVASALYLEEYAKKNKVNYWIDINISNLAGVPSIVYGMLGLMVFVRICHLGSSLVAGALTLSLLILPVIITAAREAIRAVPKSLRYASLALGASKWETIWFHVLPSATPGILTGVILALSRAIGETAPLIMVGAATLIFSTPGEAIESGEPFASAPMKYLNPAMSDYTALPMQIFDWASRPEKGFDEIAAGAIISLLVILFIINGIAVWIRHHYSQKLGD